MTIRIVEQENPDGMDAVFEAHRTLHEVYNTLRNADLNLNLAGEYTESELAAIEDCERRLPEEARRMLEEYIVKKCITEKGETSA